MNLRAKYKMRKAETLFLSYAIKKTNPMIFAYSLWTLN
jgi:hypothetical protein